MRKGGFVGCLTVAVVLMGWVGGASAEETATDRRLRVLEEQLRRAQHEIDTLRQQVEQQKAVTRATGKQVEDVDAQTKATADKVAKTPDLADWLKRTTVFGDIRYRHEGFYNQPHLTSQSVTARNRERIRARLGVRFAFSDELSATIRGASGNINDPISTNDTLSGNFNRKNFNLDLAYITFTPGKSFGVRPGAVSVNAGKFPNPIFRTDELVFDDDLSVEGLSQTFQLLDKPVGALDQVKVHALQWTFSEIANKQDGWMFGGQVNPALHFGTVQVEGGLGQYWWLNPDQIAQALSRNTTAFTASGAAVANGSFNSSLINTNRLVTRTIQPPQVKGKTKPAAFTAITGYESGFNQSNAVLATTIPDVVLTQPLRLWADYVYNWEAATDDAHGWQVGVRLGQTKVKDDWAITSFYEHIGQEAAISSFNWSDFGNAGTNLEGPGIGVDYQLLNPLTVSARANFTNFLNRPTGSTNPTFTRVQLDAMIKF